MCMYVKIRRHQHTRAIYVCMHVKIRRHQHKKILSITIIIVIYISIINHDNLLNLNQSFINSTTTLTLLLLALT